MYRYQCYYLCASPYNGHSHHNAGQGRAGQGRAGQGWAGLGRAGLSRAGLSRAGCSRVGRDSSLISVVGVKFACVEGHVVVYLLCLCTAKITANSVIDTAILECQYSCPTHVAADPQAAALVNYFQLHCKKWKCYET